MRTFVIRARKGSTEAQNLAKQIGTDAHIEVALHCIMNAFFIASDFRSDVEVYLILESSADFPRTIHLNAAKGLSLDGFHEAAILQLLIDTLKAAPKLAKDEVKAIAKGITIHGFGFEKLMAELLKTRSLYLFEPKGADLRQTVLDDNPVFILSDHLALPSKNIKSLKNKGLKTLSLGKKMLFASQCVVLINHELDRMGV